MVLYSMIQLGLVASTLAQLEIMIAGRYLESLGEQAKNVLSLLNH